MSTGQHINMRIDRPTKAGNAISIFFHGVRVALGRVEGKVDGYVGDKYVDPRRTDGADSKTDMAYNVYDVKVEHVFESGGVQIETHTFERGWWE